MSLRFRFTIQALRKARAIRAFSQSHVHFSDATPDTASDIAHFERDLTSLTETGWSVSPQHLTRALKFPSFNETYGFMTRIALHSEAINHHPEWTQILNCLWITLRSHSAGGVTARDVRLAKFINNALVNAPAKPIFTPPPNMTDWTWSAN